MRIAQDKNFLWCFAEWCMYVALSNLWQGVLLFSCLISHTRCTSVIPCSLHIVETCTNLLVLTQTHQASLWNPRLKVKQQEMGEKRLLLILEVMSESKKNMCTWKASRLCDSSPNWTHRWVHTVWACELKWSKRSETFYPHGSWSYLATHAAPCHNDLWLDTLCVCEWVLFK